jgi:hypothetical protein
MKGYDHSFIAEASGGVSDDSAGYDSDQDEKLVFIWT